MIWIGKIEPLTCVIIAALREAVAHLYNDTYRKGKASQYTYENVCIVPGGRAGLSRVAAVIGDVYTASFSPYIYTIIPLIPLQSYQIPDYTAYDQVLSAFKRLVPVPTAYVPIFLNKTKRLIGEFTSRLDAKVRIAINNQPSVD